MNVMLATLPEARGTAAPATRVPLVVWVPVTVTLLGELAIVN